MTVNEQWLASLAAALKTRLTREQGNNIRIIAAECERQSVTDKRQLAYIIATVYHECRFKSIKEIKARPGTVIWDKYQVNYWHTGFYGRGFCQLTWEKNYRKFSAVIGEDLVANPDKVLEPEIGAQVLVFGMLNGSFTALNLYSKNRLASYFSDKKTDWMGARQIVNGTFQAEKVKAVAIKILPLL